MQIKIIFSMAQEKKHQFFIKCREGKKNTASAYALTVGYIVLPIVCHYIKHNIDGSPSSTILSLS